MVTQLEKSPHLTQGFDAPWPVSVAHITKEKRCQAAVNVYMNYESSVIDTNSLFKKQTNPKKPQNLKLLNYEVEIDNYAALHFIMNYVSVAPWY